jgi:hypothetical protein
MFRGRNRKMGARCQGMHDLGQARNVDIPTISVAFIILAVTSKVNGLTTGLLPSTKNIQKTFVDHRPSITSIAGQSTEQVNDTGITTTLGYVRQDTGSLEDNSKVNQYIPRTASKIHVSSTFKGYHERARQSIHPLNQHRCTSAK